MLVCRSMSGCKNMCTCASICVCVSVPISIYCVCMYALCVRMCVNGYLHCVYACKHAWTMYALRGGMHICVWSCMHSVGGDMQMYVIMYRCIMYRCVHCVIESEHECLYTHVHVWVACVIGSEHESVNTCVYVGFGMCEYSCAFISDGEHICVCIYTCEHT